MTTDDTEGAARALYTAPPARFVAERDALARRLRATGDRDAAREVGSWRRPTVAAWWVNLLAWERPAELAELLDLATALREATAAMSGAQLRELSAQRHRVIQAMVEAAVGMARKAGARPSEEVRRQVEQTLAAAMADDKAAAQVRSGRLTTPLEHVGFGPVTAPPRGPAAAPASSHGRRAPTAGAGGRRRSALEDELARAWQAAREAADARDTAQAEAARARADSDEAQRRVGAAGERVATLRKALTEAEEELAAATEAQRRADSRDEAAVAAEREAERAAAAARRTVTTLQRRLDAL